MSSFIELCLRGDRAPSEIDDFVDEWHEKSLGISLYEFLGMSEAEYSLWAADSRVLPCILEARRSGRDVVELIEEFRALPTAARTAQSPQQPA